MQTDSELSLLCAITNFNSIMTDRGFEPMTKSDLQDYIHGGENMNELNETADYIIDNLQTTQAESAYYAKHGDPIYGEPMEDEY